MSNLYKTSPRNMSPTSSRGTSPTRVRGTSPTRKSIYSEKVSEQKKDVCSDQDMITREFRSSIMNGSSTDIIEDIINRANSNGLKLDLDYYVALEAESGYLETIKLLVSYGADVHASNDDAFFSAIANYHLDTVKYIVGYGMHLKTMIKGVKLAIDENSSEILCYLLGCNAVVWNTPALLECITYAANTKKCTKNTLKNLLISALETLTS